MLLVVNSEKPPDAKLNSKNSYEIEVVPIEVAVQMRVVPIVKSREIVVNEFVADINSEIPLEKNVQQVDDN